MMYTLDMMHNIVPRKLKERDTARVDTGLARVILYIGSTLATALKDIIIYERHRDVTKQKFDRRMAALDSLVTKGELPARSGGVAVTPLVENEVMAIYGVRKSSAAHGTMLTRS
ncbi:MAG: hypothetical protein Q9173_003021 [Seirophora scorigena]